jgi:hypothetical protein
MFYTCLSTSHTEYKAGGFDRDDVRSGFGLSIDVDVVSIAGGGGFDRDDVRSGFGLSIDPCCPNVVMVKLNHIQSTPSHHEYDRIDR